jgi:hypothetical protein
VVPWGPAISQNRSKLQSVMTSGGEPLAVLMIVPAHPSRNFP